MKHALTVTDAQEKTFASYSKDFPLDISTLLTYSSLFNWVEFKHGIEMKKLVLDDRLAVLKARTF